MGLTNIFQQAVDGLCDVSVVFLEEADKAASDDTAGCMFRGCFIGLPVGDAETDEARVVELHGGNAPEIVLLLVPESGLCSGRGG